MSTPTAVVFQFIEHFKCLRGKLCGKAKHVFRGRKCATRCSLTASVAEYALSRVCEFLHVHTTLENRNHIFLAFLMWHIHYWNRMFNDNPFTTDWIVKSGQYIPEWSLIPSRKKVEEVEKVFVIW